MSMPPTILVPMLWQVLRTLGCIDFRTAILVTAVTAAEDNTPETLIHLSSVFGINDLAVPPTQHSPQQIHLDPVIFAESATL